MKERGVGRGEREREGWAGEHIQRHRDIETKIIETELTIKIPSKAG